MDNNNVGQNLEFRMEDGGEQGWMEEYVNREIRSISRVLEKGIPLDEALSMPMSLPCRMPKLLVVEENDLLATARSRVL